MKIKIGTYLVTLTIIVLTLTSCNRAILKAVTTVNSRSSIEKPYLLLISLDGFRWDYVEKYSPPNLSAFIANGVKAAALIPSYPSKTFPNHYTIATGLYPDKHGILGNTFYSYEKGLVFNKSNQEQVVDGSFYKGSPIWIEANKANMVTASYFFVGTEAAIRGIKPTYYYKFDGSVKNEVRISQAIKWLELPAETRPHLITLYFGDMDKVGHKFGPAHDEELKKALFALDNNLADLFKGVAETGLPVNIIIVSDHGMADQSTANLIPIEAIENDSLFLTVDNGSIVNIHPKKDIETDVVLQYLKQKEDHFKVYKTKNTPGFEYSPANKDWGAIQLIPDVGYYFLAKKSKASLIKNDVKTIGVHGYDTKYKDMHGIFYANGPAFKSGYVIPPVKNIHIYPLMCKLLGLKIPKTIDGNLNEIKSVLKTN